MIDDTRELEELKTHLKEYADTHLQADRKAGKNMYVCPFCGSGSRGGRNSDGAFSVNTKENYYKCFSCNETGDIFTLHAKLNGLDIKRDFAEIKKQLGDMYGVRFDTYQPITYQRTEKRPLTANTSDQTSKNDSKEPLQDYTEYLRSCKASVSGVKPYLYGRGFTDQTIQRFNFGYDSQHNALVIPYPQKNYYITRSLTERKFYKPASDQAGEEPIFNINSLYSNEPCFVCESQLDAVSIEQAGGKAIALGGANGYTKLIEQVKQRKPTAPLILSLDNDETGRKFTGVIADQLTALNIPHVTATYTLDSYPTDKQKDANEYLQGNGKQLAEDIQKNKASARMAVISPETRKLLEGSNIANYLQNGFRNDLTVFQTHSKCSTGFEYLDSQSGGLYSGFYVVGAISSLGKTTFVHQIADNLAEAGKHILYFSLEQTRLELVTKSLSRIIAKRHGTKDPVSSITIREGNYTATQWEWIKEAVLDYQRIADKVTIIECTFNADISFIKNTVEDYIKVNHVRPVVIIDYLQIINTEQVNGSDKQKIDSVVKGLKRLQSENNITLIAISSVNRSNYLTPVDFESFKESGIIEYSTDVVYGLQLQCLSDELFNKDNNIVDKRKKIIEAKSAVPRKIQLVCLKNRYGISNYSTYFDYYPTCDYFKESLQDIERKELVTHSPRL